MEAIRKKIETQEFSRWALLAAFPLLGVLVALIATLLMPKKYESTALFEVREPTSYHEASRKFFAPAYSAAFPEPLLQARLLREVIHQENLLEKWKIEEDEAIHAIKEMLSTKPTENPHQFSVKIVHNDPQEAQQILGTLIKNYSAKRSREESRRASRQIEELLAEIKDQRAKIKASESSSERQNHQLLLEELLKKHIQEKATLSEPIHPITIHQKASFNENPFSPRPILNLTLASIAGSLISVVTFLTRNKNQLTP